VLAIWLCGLLAYLVLDRVYPGRGEGIGLLVNFAMVPVVALWFIVWFVVSLLRDR
jgi:hypothetical protein